MISRDNNDEIDEQFNFASIVRRPSYIKKLLHGFLFPCVPLGASIVLAYFAGPVGGSGESCGFYGIFVSALIAVFVPLWSVLALLIIVIPWRSLFWVRILCFPPPIIVALLVIQMWPICAMREQAAPPPPAIDTNSSHQDSSLEKSQDLPDTSYGANKSIDLLKKPNEHITSEVQLFIQRSKECNHWAGEDGYDIERRSQINKAIQDLGCIKIADDKRALLLKYAMDSQSIFAINSSDTAYF